VFPETDKINDKIKKKSGNIINITEKIVAKENMVETAIIDNKAT
jgi:hypothetical protein